MRKIFLLSTLLLFFMSGYCQKIVSPLNPLEKLLQKEFDTTILYSATSNWDTKPNFYIISKDGNYIYFYQYNIHHKSYSGKMIAPRKSEIFPKLFSLDNNIKNVQPDLNQYFKWVDTRNINSSIWEAIVNYGLWNLVDDTSKKLHLGSECGITDGVGVEIKLISKDKIVQLNYYDPEGLNECKFDQTRDIITKVGRLIMEFYK